MEPLRQDERILRIMNAEEKGERYVALPCDDFGWEVKDLEMGEVRIPGDTIQHALATCIASILNIKSAENEKHL